MKKILLITILCFVGGLIFSQSGQNIYEELQKESNSLLSLSAGLFNLSYSLDSNTPDSGRVKAAAIVVGRYVFDIQNIASLIKLETEMNCDQDRELLKKLYSLELSVLALRLSGEKNPIFDAPKLIDPLEFDNYQARKEVDKAITELERTGNRLLAINKIITN